MCDWCENEGETTEVYTYNLCEDCHREVMILVNRMEER